MVKLQRSYVAVPAINTWVLTFVVIREHSIAKLRSFPNRRSVYYSLFHTQN